MPYCTSVKTGLINAISHRLAAYVQSDDHFVSSSVLEPRFRLKWTSSQAEKMAAKSLVIEHMDLLVEQTAAAAADQPTEQGITDCMFAQDELFGFMSNTRESSTVVELEATWLMHQISRRWHFGHSTKSSVQCCTNFTWSTTPYLPLQQLWNDASVQLAISPVLVGPACQMTCLKLRWLLSVTKTFCGFLVRSDYGHW